MLVHECNILEALVHTNYILRVSPTQSQTPNCACTDVIVFYHTRSFDIACIHTHALIYTIVVVIKYVFMCLAVKCYNETCVSARASAYTHARVVVNESE